MKHLRSLFSRKKIIQSISPAYQILKNKIANDPYYRLQSLEEIEIAKEIGIKIDVNQATVDDWLKLPGISIHQAKILVNLVSNGVQILCLEDLAAALNVSPKSIKVFEPILQFEYYDFESSLSPPKININSANEKELSEIPCLSAALITEILKERHAQGNYQDLIDLKNRLQINSELISQLMYYLSF